MIDKIYLSNYEICSTSKIAELLGLNYDAENNIAYYGNNKYYGFRVREDGAMAQIIPVINGSQGAFLLSMSTIGYLFYKKTENGIIFGYDESDRPNLHIGFTKGYKLDDNTEVPIMFFRPIYNNSTIRILMNNETTKSIAENNIISDSYAYLERIYDVPGISTDFLFVTKVFKQTCDVTEFTLNGDTYVTMYTLSDQAKRLAFKV